ncbi:GDSL-type esterase/lipase family protein [Mesorhizobium sp. M0340]|uniref:SGNH/GDSL hydrolase family protein n=1 Tax=Mesorhizobium sp. M0340 TaxID=2956939 RepID=UPI003335E53F
MSLSVGATLLDLKVSAADLGLRVGEPVEIIVDLIAAQSLQIIGSIAVASGVAHNESNTVNLAVAGGLGYMSVGLTVTPTQNDVTFGTSLLVRLNIAAGVGANGLFVLGWAVQKAKSRLTYIGGALQSAAMVAEDAHPKLNIDPFFRIAASGVTNDYAGNPLIGASAGGFPPVLVNAPAGSPFGTRPSSCRPATLHDIKTPVAEAGLTVGETVWCIFAFMAGSAQSIQFIQYIPVSSGVTQTAQITKTVNGLTYISLPIVVTQNDVTYGLNHQLRILPTGALAADAYLLGWAIQKAPGRLIDNHGRFDKLAKDVASVPASQFAGKIGAHFGDSIIESVIWPGITPTAKIAQRTGMTITNCGGGGTRMANHATNYDKFSFYRLADAIASGDFSQQIAAATLIGGTFPAIAARMASVDYSLLDYLIPSFGTNDFTGAGPTCPIGTNADITGATFKGAINYGIQTIMTARPNLKLIFTTPIWRTLDSTAGGAGSQLIDYANAMLEVCALNRVPVVDLYRRFIINQFNYVHWMGPGDGTHPNNLGQDLIGGMMAAGLFDNF